MKKTITLSIDDKIFKEFKKLCVDLGTYVSSKTQELMKEYSEKMKGGTQEK